MFWLKRVRLSIRCTSWACFGLGRDLLIVTSLYENMYLCFMESGGLWKRELYSCSGRGANRRLS